MTTDPFLSVLRLYVYQGNFGGGSVNVAGGSSSGNSDSSASNHNNDHQNDAEFEEGDVQAILRQRFLGMSNLEQEVEFPADVDLAVGRYQVSYCWSLSQYRYWILSLTFIYNVYDCFDHCAHLC
jgi:hypothetical protein